MSRSQHEPVSFAFIFQSLKRYWYVAATCLGLTVVLGLGYLESTDPVFEAEVRVLIQRRDLSLELDAERKQEKEFLTTQAEVISSPLTVTPALDSVPLTAEELEKEKPMQRVLEDLKINPLASTDILRVTYRHTDPVLATRRLEAILESYQENLRQQERLSSANLLVILSTREERLREELTGLQSQYAELRGSSPVVGEIKNSISTETGPMKDLTDRLTEARTRRWQLETALNQNESETDSVISSKAALAGNWNPEVLKGVRELEGEIRNARGERTRIAQVYGTSHSHWQEIDARVKQLENDYQRFLVIAASSLKTRLATARAEEEQLEQALQRERTRMKNLDQYVLRESQLQQQINEVQKMHTDAATSLQALNLTDHALEEGRVSVTVQVLDDFTIPENPVWPQPIPFLVISVLVGSLVGLIAVYLLAVVVPNTGSSSPGTPSVSDPEEEILRQMQAQLDEMQSSLAGSRFEPKSTSPEEAVL